MVRHLFPGVSLKDIDDEEFAILANEAEWLFSEKAKLSIGAGLGKATGGGQKKKPNQRSAPKG